MEDYQKQFQEELQRQEIKSNKRTLQGFLWFFAAMTLIYVLTVVNFFVVDQSSMNQAFLLSLLMGIPVLAIYVRFHSDLSRSFIKYVLLLLICVISGIVAAILSFHATLIYVIPLLFAIQYRKRSALWFAYVINVVTMTAGMVAGFYYGLCDLNLLLVSNHTRTWYLERISDGMLQLPLNGNMFMVIVVWGAMPRALVLLIYALMLRNIIIGGHEDALRIAQLTHHKDMDLKTGLYNKNKYEEMLNTYYQGVEEVGAIFWDVNHLKMVNDRFGHATGDVLIGMVAERLKSQTSDRRRVYRIGGDEFVMLIDDPEEDEIEGIIREVSRSLQESEKKAGFPVSSAAGYAKGKGSEIRQIVNRADASMYENKNGSREAGR